MEMQLVFFNLDYIRELFQLAIGVGIFFLLCVPVLAIVALIWKGIDAIIN